MKTNSDEAVGAYYSDEQYVPTTNNKRDSDKESPTIEDSPISPCFVIMMDWPKNLTKKQRKFLFINEQSTNGDYPSPCDLILATRFGTLEMAQEYKEKFSKEKGYLNSNNWTIHELKVVTIIGA